MSISREKIISAAIRIVWYLPSEELEEDKSKIGQHYIIICGKNHGECFQKMSELHIYGEKKLNVQGFLTNKGRFVDRQSALDIATNAGQIIYKHHPNDELLSEDLYMNRRGEIVNGV